jgi:hypothetical protein
MGMTLQHSRFLSEAAPTALLWAISIGGFLEGARTGRAWPWALAGLTGGLSLYFYPSARLWAVGAALTIGVLVLQLRDRRVLLGAGVATIATLVAAAPFLVHLSTRPDETTNRYLQTTVLDPTNQARLDYLQPPEPLPRLAALQVERTLGMFDRYPDGGGFWPTGQPLFGQPLAALALVGAVYALVRAFRDARFAVISIWFWLGLSGVASTVETPSYLRAVGMLPSLCVVLAAPLVDLVNRVVRDRSGLRGLVAVGVTLVLIVPEVSGYFGTFRSMPSSWGAATREGQTVAALGEIGPVYALEMNEHAVSSGWVRLLAPRAARGRLPNPGRELPILGGDVLPRADQGLSILLSADPNQRPYVELLRQLYPRHTVRDVGDGRRAFQVSAVDLAETRGVSLIGLDGEPRPVARFGELPGDLPLPNHVTWRAGVLVRRTGALQLAVTAPERALVRLDGIALTTGASTVDVQAVRGLHFLELESDLTVSVPPISVAMGQARGELREPTSVDSYSLMDAPWGLLGRATPGPDSAFLDATVAMAFFTSDISVRPPGSVVWSGALVAPRDGVYRMAFAAEDSMHLQLDERAVDVVTVKPDDWAKVGLGSQVRLSQGSHTVRVTLEVTHSGRELARWNWVPPAPTGALDADAEWSVVPPWVLRPDPPVAPGLPAPR